MFEKLAVRLGAHVIANPAILVELAPIIIPVAAVALICDAIDKSEEAKK